MAENAFELLAARFRCLLTAVPQNADKVSTIVLACCVPHNILMIMNPTMDVNAVDKENVTAGVSSGDDAAAAAVGAGSLLRDFLGMTGVCKCQNEMTALSSGSVLYVRRDRRTTGYTP